MHIILGLLGTIVTILILLNRLADAGIDLGGLNPFLWSRRRQWRKKYQGNPIYSLEKAMDIAAMLIVATAKSDGDISLEEKHKIMDIFINEFQLSRRDASSLMVASVYLIQDGEEIHSNIVKVVDIHRDKFSDEQAASTLALIKEVAAIDKSATKDGFIASIESGLVKNPSPERKWET